MVRLRDLHESEAGRRAGAGRTADNVTDRLTEADDPMSGLVRGLLIPEGHYRGGSAF